MPTQTLACDGCQPFDAAATMRRLSEEANHGCGSVYELYHSRLLAAVDGRANALAAADAAALISEATANWDYVPADSVDVEAYDPNVCMHGLDSMTCPCGCFEGD